MGDMPKMLHRELVGRRLGIKDCQEMFKKTLQIWEDQQRVMGLSYDPEVQAHPNILVEPRVMYMTELIRQVAHVSRRVVAVVDEGLMPHIEDKWMKMPRELRSLETLLQVKDPNFKPKSVIEMQDTWLEFIEKQVIMDSLFEPFIWKNYV
jgi:pheromone shutdown protein TraB